jgi:hypothetical protein
LGAGFDGRMEVTYSDGDHVTYPVTMAPTKEDRLIGKFRANTVHTPRGALVELEYPLLAEKPSVRTIAKIATAMMTGRVRAQP